MNARHGAGCPQAQELFAHVCTCGLDRLFRIQTAAITLVTSSILRDIEGSALDLTTRADDWEALLAALKPGRDR